MERRWREPGGLDTNGNGAQGELRRSIAMLFGPTLLLQDVCGYGGGEGVLWVQGVGAPPPFFSIALKQCSGGRYALGHQNRGTSARLVELNAQETFRKQAT